MDLDFVLAIGNPSLTHQPQVKKEQGEHSQYGTPWSYEITGRTRISNRRARDTETRSVEAGVAGLRPTPERI